LNGDPHRKGTIAIIVPFCFIPGEENEATSNENGCMLKIMKQLFPRREIIQIDPLLLNWHGGGMHCLLQQQPAAFR